MNRTWTTVLAALMLAALPGFAKADPSQAMTDIAEKTTDAVVMVSCKVEMEGKLDEEEPTIQGLGICLNATEGWFMTMAFDPSAQLSHLKDFELLLPGAEGKSIKAKLLGMDPGTGIAIVKATEPYKWKAVGFAPTAKLPAGQMVISVGLMGGDGGRTPYLGLGYVSAVFRVPGQLVYVTGGNLTGIGSPVFAPDGRAVGIVGRQQLPMSYQMNTARGSAAIGLAGRQETSFFLPIDEFVHVLRDPPVGAARRLPWIGATRFEPVSEELANIIKLDRPGVMVDNIVPDQAADKAGLKNRDVIVAMDGKPLEKLATPTLVAQNFVRLLMRRKPGEIVKLTALRGTKQPQELSITLGEMPQQPHEAERYVQKQLGFIVREKVTLDEYTDRGPTAKVPGLVVIYVAPQSSGAAGGLKPGDLLTSCNDQPVKTIKGFRQIVEGAVANKPNEAVNLLVRRGDQSMAISLQVPKQR